MSVTRIFIFGHGQTCPFTGKSLLDHHIAITAATPEQCRAVMVAVFGQGWSFPYDTLDQATRGGQFPSTEHMSINLGQTAGADYRRGQADGRAALAQELADVRDVYNAVQAAGEAAWTPAPRDGITDDDFAGLDAAVRSARGDDTEVRP